MYNDCNIRIERLQNGYNVRVTDPDIQKKNEARNKSTKDECTPWSDPQVTYAFSTTDEVVDFITNNLDKMLPVDAYSSTFDQAAKDSSDG